MRSKQTKFALEFKQEAVKLVTSQGYTQAEAAKNLGVSSKNISRWIIELDGKAIPVKKAMLSAEQEELQCLRKEIKCLKLEREILKKAAVVSTGECNRRLVSNMQSYKRLHLIAHI